MAKKSVDLNKLGGRVLSNARDCWSSFVAWDRFSSGRETSEIEGLLRVSGWSFLPFEAHLSADVVIRLAILFDSRYANQASFHAYRKAGGALSNVDSAHKNRLTNLLKVRHHAVAHWNAEQSVAEWIAASGLKFEDVKQLLGEVRRLHDELLALELASPPDTFEILRVQTLAKVDAFVDVLRDGARFKLVEPNARERAKTYYSFGSQ